MEKGYFTRFITILCLLSISLALNNIRYQCPSTSGTLVSDSIKVSVDGDIALTNQDSYCYTLTLPKYFKNRPNIAIALNRFKAQQTRDLYLSIKPLPVGSNNLVQNAQSLTTISFSVNLYQVYTKWNLIEFFFLAEDRSDIEAGYMMIDGASLGRCDTGKTISAFLPMKNSPQEKLQAYTFLHGFQISSKTPSATDKYSPLQVQILSKKVTPAGVTVTISVTSATQVYSLLISYVVFQQGTLNNKVYGGIQVFQNYEQYPTESVRTISHSPQVYIDQLWGRISGLSGFIVNSNQYALEFDSGDFTSVFNLKVNNFWKYFSFEYVIFIGGICSDCAGYPVYYLGQCIVECPPQTTFNGYTCIKCSQNQIWNGTHCISRCTAGKVWIDNNCYCPNNFEWNGYACVACAGGKVWNPQTRTCACPVSTIWNGFTCIACDGGRYFESNSKSCVCPLGTTWNGYSCQSTCPADQYFNTTTQQCQCQVNFIWNGSKCIQCTGGRFYNSYTRQCECQNGLWNGYVCGTNCQNGMSWNSYLNTCECPKRTYLLNSGCIPCGSVSGDSQRTECRCPNPNTYFNGYDCVLCDRNRVFSAFLGTCECPTNKQWNGTDCVSSVCPKGYDQVGKSCFCPLNSNEINGQCVVYTNCDAGMAWNNQYSRCEPISCVAGSYWDGQRCYAPVDTSQCPFGTYWNGFSCASYADACPQGTQWTGDYCQTVQKKCPVGTYYTGTTCIPIPSECPAQLTWNDAQGRCVPVNNICPTGTYYNGYSCMPYSACKNGQVWSNTLVQCVCPDNSFWNGLNCVNCVGGMLYGFDGCYCPLGTFFDGTQCSKVPVADCQSIPYSVLNGNSCDCLPGFDKVNGACVCSGVLVSATQCDKCAAKPNSKWNGYICECSEGYIEVFGKCKAKNQTPNPTGTVKTTKSACAVGTYFDQFEQKCLLCSDGCLSCKNCYDCQQCRPEYTYFAPSKGCVQICGDGKRFSLECDDGNNINGDGCSSDCKLEPEFTCIGGSPNSKDTCSKYKPQKLVLTSTGQTHLFGKIILNIRLNYLPNNLTQNISQCKQSCDRILMVKLVDGQKTFLSINSLYIKGTTYSFSVEIDFGREPIAQFSAQVSINEKVKEKYFAGIDTSTTVKVDVNPAYLALVASKKEDKLK